MAAINDNSVLRVLIVRLGSMGDVIHALPAAAGIRAMYPGVEIGWGIEERWVELLASSEAARLRRRSPEKPLADRIHLINTQAWRQQPFSGQTWKEVWRSASELRDTHYEVAIDIQGAWKSAFVALVSGAPVRIGFREPREHGAGVFYNREVMAKGNHIVEQNFSLLAGLVRLAGDARDDARQEVLRRGPPPPQLPRDEAHELWACEELGRHGLLEREFAIVNPGAGWGAKRWPAESYAAVARGLGEMGVCSLVNFGPGEDELAKAVAAGSGGAALAFRYTLAQLIALTRRARLFVGGDTGPMHLAAALGVPVVAIFGPTNPARNGPYGTQAIVLRSPESVTSHSRRAQPDAAMLTISAVEVLAAARELLERTRARGGAA
ncbi:MAG: glycosyltransferase family 9 protein [Terriglobales bacterium]